MPRSSASGTAQTRERLLRAVGRGFRTHGYGGLGVDKVADDAGVTSGAFYAHFGSKASAFEAALGAGFEDLRVAIRARRATGDPRWLAAFAEWYLSAQRRSDIGGSCVLPTLTLEAARRTDASTRATYREQLQAVIDELTAPGPGRLDEPAAISVLALLAGGMAFAHAVAEGPFGERIARAISTAVAAHVEGDSDAEHLQRPR